jgi:hypothetical protein
MNNSRLLIIFSIVFIDLPGFRLVIIPARRTRLEAEAEGSHA